jgi:peptidoglycan hydrolase CwlO-like protein
VSDRDRRGRAAELRAEQIRWKDRSRNMSQASKSMDEQLRKMNEQANELDKRLGHHAEESASWHKKWNEPPGLD